MASLIHPSAIISPSARLGQGVTIGAFSIVGDNVVLADNVELKSHVVIEGHTEIGENTVIFPFASIGHAPQDLKFKGEISKIVIGKNNVIREYCTIQPGTESGTMQTIIGDSCLLMVGTHIAHDCKVGNNVIFANNATLAGHVTVENNVLLGGLCAVHQFVRIGQFAVLGGLSPVARDVPPFAMVSGERASIEGVNLIGLRRKGFDAKEINAVQEAINDIFFCDGQISKKILDTQQKFPESKLVSELLKFMNSPTARSYITAKGAA